MCFFLFSNIPFHFCFSHFKHIEWAELVKPYSHFITWIFLLYLRQLYLNYENNIISWKQICLRANDCNYIHICGMWIVHFFLSFQFQQFSTGKNSNSTKYMAVISYIFFLWMKLLEISQWMYVHASVTSIHILTLNLYHKNKTQMETNTSTE